MKAPMTRQQQKEVRAQVVLQILDASHVNPEEDIEAGYTSHRRLLSEFEAIGFTRTQLAATLISLLDTDVVARKKWHLDHRQWLYWRADPLIRSVCAQGPRDRVEDAYGFQNNVMVVCDGMGGHVAGDKAAQCMVGLTLRDGFRAVVDRCQEVVQVEADYGAGTTFSGIRRDGDILYWLHCGDSALWVLVVDGDAVAFRRLTPDQSRWGSLRALHEKPSSLRSKSILDSCIIGGRPSFSCPRPTWNTGALDLKELPKTSEVWIIGTTDGFHEAFEFKEDGVDGAQVRGDVDEVRLGSELHALTTASSFELRYAADTAATSTGDNATLVMWRVQ